MVARFGGRAVLLRQDDDSQHVYAILAGCVKVSRAERDGCGTTLTLNGSGDLAGDMAAVDRRPRW